MYDDIAQFQRRMPELEEKVVMGLVKKLGMEKEKVEEAHIAFLDKHPEGQMTRFDFCFYMFSIKETIQTSKRTIGTLWLCGFFLKFHINVLTGPANID